MIARLLGFIFVVFSCTLFAVGANAQGKIELQWFAQSAFKLTTLAARS